MSLQKVFGLDSGPHGLLSGLSPVLIPFSGDIMSTSLTKLSHYTRFLFRGPITSRYGLLHQTACYYLSGPLPTKCIPHTRTPANKSPAVFISWALCLRVLLLPLLLSLASPCFSQVLLQGPPEDLNLLPVFPALCSLCHSFPSNFSSNAPYAQAFLYF